MNKHVEALVNGLDGRPQDFIFTGEVFQAEGACACGHAILWNFVVSDSKNKVPNKVLGSTCIENYSLYNPENAEKMKTEWKAIQEQIKKAKAEKKALEQKKKVDEVASIWETKRLQVLDYYQSFRRKYQRAPYSLWCFVNRENYQNFPVKNMVSKFKRPSLCIKRMEADIKRMENLLTLTNEKSS
jgi:hypothetical protein